MLPDGYEELLVRIIEQGTDDYRSNYRRMLKTKDGKLRDLLLKENRTIIKEVAPFYEYFSGLDIEIEEIFHKIEREECELWQQRSSKQVV